MPYNFVSEDDKSFKLSNGDSEFSVAKYGLDDGFMEQLRMLPRAYQNGGVVEDQLAVAPANAAEEAYAASGGLLGDLGENIGEAIEVGASAPVGIFAQPSGIYAPEPTESPVSVVPTSPTAPATAPTPTPTPEAPQPTEAKPLPYMDLMNQMMAGQKPQGAQVPSDMAKAFEDMKAASMMDAQAKAAASTASQQAMNEAVADMQLEQIRFDTKLRGLDNEQQILIKDYAANKIDPTRIYSQTSTGNRVLAGISVLLGGIGQGLTGAKTNPAMDVINNAIDRDLDAQKAELGKKQNLLSLNLHKYGQLKDALAATKMQIMTIAQAQVNSAAAKAGTTQAIAAAKMFNADMDLKLATIKQQLAAAGVMSDKLNDPRGMSAKDVLKMNQDLQDKMVQLPNGNYLPAFNKESAAKVREIQSEIYRVKDTINEARKFMEQGSTLPLTNRNRLAKTINQRILGELKSKAMLDLGALTESDLRLLEPMVPSVGDFFSTASKQKLDQLDEMLNSKMNAHYSSYVPGLNPSGRRSRETSVFRRP